MDWNEHWDLQDKHAFLGASQHSWLNYSDDKLESVYKNNQLKILGTRLHFLASEHIKLGIKMPTSKKTLNMFINDAIGYKMQSEQVLYYSDNCFGTTDAISFKRYLLRIHDLKTGIRQASMDQLYIYAALFCLEYHWDPSVLNFELRIYQNDDIIIDIPDASNISWIMQKIIAFDKIINRIREEGVLS